MATTSDLSVYEIDCPLLCGAASTLTIGGYDDPVTVNVCPSCAAQGGTGWTVTVGQAEYYMRPAVATSWQHADGLVTFQAAAVA